MDLKEFFWIKLFGGKVGYPLTQMGRERPEVPSKAAIDAKAATFVKTAET